jgi:DUF1680 family protein
MARPSRRSVLSAASAVGAAVALPTTSRAAVGAKIRPFALDQITLGAGPLRQAQEVNRSRLLALDTDRLLHMFRVTAGIPSSVEPLGGWEAPVNELRGHFTGHYLSACAQMAAQGDAACKAKGRAVVRGLAACQAKNGSGYVSAFPASFFERLDRRERVWAPFYTLHKILAGLLDMHATAGDMQALQVARGLGDWTDRWSAKIEPQHMQAVLDTEFGGMGEALWNLHAVTGEARYAAAAERFEKRKFLDPLAERRDTLTGLHANTHIPQAIAAARKAELTGDERSHDIASFFWADVTGARTFVTGGTSSGEAWKEPLGRLSKELDAYTHECCCTHNMLKLTRHVFGWTGDPGAAAYYERALYNGILGTHHPDNGMMMYYTPMASGFWKMFSDHDNGFWCCDGTGIESFSKLGDSLYFQDAGGLYVNLYAPSELDWRERGVRVIQTGGPPDEHAKFEIRAPRPTRFALRLRIPAWAEGAAIMLNGEPGPAATPGGYTVLERTWRDGDRVELTLPMGLHLEAVADDPTLKAVLYGPYVLAGRLGAESLPPEAPYAQPTKPREVPEFRSDPAPAPTFKAPSADPRSWIEPAPGEAMTFRTKGQVRDVDFVPFNRLQHDRYGVYWRVETA